MKTTTSSRGAGRCGRSSQGAFTLLEVVAALALMAILALVVFARGGTSEASVAAEAAILRGHLRFVQAMAMANNTVAWTVNLGSTSYTMQRDGAAATVNLPDESAPTHILTRGVVISQGIGVLPISEWGVPDQTRVITVSDGQYQQSVIVLGGTGLIQ